MLADAPARTVRPNQKARQKRALFSGFREGSVDADWLGLRRLGLGGFFLYELHALEAAHAEAEVAQFTEEAAVGELQGARGLGHDVREVAAGATGELHDLGVAGETFRRNPFVAVFGHRAHATRPFR